MVPEAQAPHPEQVVHEAPEDPQIADIDIMSGLGLPEKYTNNKIYDKRDSYKPEEYSRDSSTMERQQPPPRDTSSPVIFSTEVRHTVSAVISWTMTADTACEEAVVLAGIPKIPTVETYEVRYHPDGKPELSIELTTTKTVLLLTGLEPDARYRYTVRAYRPQELQPQWSASDVLETNYKK